MRYYISPPSFQSKYAAGLFSIASLGSTSKGIRRHLTARNWEDLVAWADAEYQQAFAKSVECGNYKFARILSREWSGMRILSGFANFRWFCANIEQETWDKLDRKTRKFITKAYDMYELLRG